MPHKKKELSWSCYLAWPSSGTNGGSKDGSASSTWK